MYITSLDGRGAAADTVSRSALPLPGCERGCAVRAPDGFLIQSWTDLEVDRGSSRRREDASRFHVGSCRLMRKRLIAVWNDSPSSSQALLDRSDHGFERSTLALLV